MPQTSRSQRIKNFLWATLWIAAMLYVAALLIAVHSVPWTKCDTISSLLSNATTFIGIFAAGIAYGLTVLFFCQPLRKALMTLIWIIGSLIAAIILYEVVVHLLPNRL